MLHGGSGVDRLYGGSGNDALNGGDQGDYLYHAGEDTLDGVLAMTVFMAMMVMIL